MYKTKNITIHLTNTNIDAKRLLNDDSSSAWRLFQDLQELLTRKILCIRALWKSWIR
jgi:hypothetical protein